jgi:hypothetical protein
MRSVDRLPEAVTAVLHQGEQARIAIRARVARRYTETVTWITFAPFIAAFDWLSNALHLRRARNANADIGFPLHRKMLLVVTGERLLASKCLRSARSARQQRSRVPRS